MKTYDQFVRTLILEGGNVEIDGHEATRIDLTQTDRTQIIKSIGESLDEMNKSFRKMFGIHIWSPDLFNSHLFLSGSAFHFFDKSITNEVFRKHKPTVGDIDTQVDKNLMKSMDEFLTKNKGKKFKNMTLFGFKKSPGQFISLWNEEKTGLNIQVDFEFVDFHKGSPTEWSQFSHSAMWSDIVEDIKGVFHKYALRALTARTLRDAVVIRGKTEKKVKMPIKDLAFSVVQGLRQRYRPVTDSRGKQLFDDGLPVYKEIPTNESSYDTNVDTIFSALIGNMPTKQEKNKFYSFIGIIEILDQKYTPSEKKSFINAYADLLWGKGAQKLVKGNPDEDYKIKLKSFKKAIDIMSLQEDKSITLMRQNFYRNY